MEEDEVEHDLVMPFVVVRSVGGPFDDDSFVVGWECGMIDQTLKLGSQFGVNMVEKTVHTSTLPQLDLVAMRYGYKIEKCEKDESNDWTTVAFSLLKEEI